MQQLLCEQGIMAYLASHSARQQGIAIWRQLQNIDGPGPRQAGFGEAADASVPDKGLQAQAGCCMQLCMVDWPVCR